MFAASLEWSFPVYFLVVCNFFFVFPSRLPCRDRGSGSCFTGHLPGIGNIFILVWRFRISGGGDAAIKQGQLVAMRHGKKKSSMECTCQQFCCKNPRQIRGLTSHTNIFEIWRSMLPLCLRISGFNVCSLGILLLLEAWAVHDIRGSQTFQAYRRHADLGS